MPLPDLDKFVSIIEGTSLVDQYETGVRVLWVTRCASTGFWTQLLSSIIKVVGSCCQYVFSLYEHTVTDA